MKGAQLALPVQLQQTPAFDNFFAGPNIEIVQTLRDISSAGARSPVFAVWLYGGGASGKTHLLRAAALAAGQRAQYLTLKEPALRQPDRLALQALVEAPLLALDDVDAALDDRDAALALLRLIDRRRSFGLPLLLAAGAPPSRLNIELQDLATRLSAMALLGIKPLRGADRRELLRLHAHQRGLELPEDAIAWLLAHLRRDAGTLIAALEELDRATLSAKRRPTLPFVQQTLGPLLQPSLAL